MAGSSQALEFKGPQISQASLGTEGGKGLSKRASC